jgi:C4-dicarboxylate transporter
MKNLLLPTNVFLWNKYTDYKNGCTKQQQHKHQGVNKTPPCFYTKVG